LAMLKTSPLNTICEVHENESGLHFLLQLHTHLSEEEVQKKLDEEDMRMQSLSDYYMDNQKNQKHMYIIHYSNLPLDHMTDVFDRIYELVHD
ncbi:MAG TPA: GntR family transcriptional regulator, partial [Erysipelotrichaceae bacterium]|nr:GntR family transcriptional regulator [Erysipelotrichaceae bacterium]